MSSGRRMRKKEKNDSDGGLEKRDSGVKKSDGGEGGATKSLVVVP